MLLPGPVDNFRGNILLGNDLRADLHTPGAQLLCQTVKLSLGFGTALRRSFLSMSSDIRCNCIESVVVKGKRLNDMQQGKSGMQQFPQRQSRLDNLGSA